MWIEGLGIIISDCSEMSDGYIEIDDDEDDFDDDLVIGDTSSGSDGNAITIGRKTACDLCCLF